MEKCALLIIDMQNDFVEKGSLLQIKSIQNLKRYNSFIDACRQSGLLIVYTRHIFSPKNNPIEAKLFPRMKHVGLRDHTHGSEICNALKPQKGDLIIKKRRYDAFLGTRLENIFNRKKITTLIITGTMTNVCCESTARTGMMKDFNILFCSDLAFTSSKKLHSATLKNISHHFGTVLTSNKIIFRLKHE